METRNLGHSDVNVTVLAFGAWAIGGWMWGGADSKEAVNFVLTDDEIKTINTLSSELKIDTKIQ